MSSCLAVSNQPLIKGRLLSTGHICPARLLPAIQSPHLSRAITLPKRHVRPTKTNGPCIINFPSLTNSNSTFKAGVANCIVLGRMRVSCAKSCVSRCGNSAPTVRFHCTSILLGCTRTLTRGGKTTGTNGVVRVLRPLHRHTNVPSVSFSHRCGASTRCPFEGLSGCVRTMHHRHQIRGTLRNHQMFSVVH